MTKVQLAKIISDQNKHYYWLSPTLYRKMKKARRAFTLIEVFVVFCILGIFLSLVFGSCCAINGTSEGHRDGYIQKVSTKNGMFISSWEADMALPGFGGSQEGKGGQNVMGNVWSFSVADKKVWDKINEVTAEQLIRVYYKESRWQWSHYTDYLATKIEVLDRHK